MDHRIPKVGVVISLVLALGAVITFIFLNNAFQGPNPVGFLSKPYELTAHFDDNKTLPTKQAVLYKGIEVGKVTGVKRDASGKGSIVSFSLDGTFDLRKDAVIRIGYRSLLGDPYLAVDSRGSDGEPKLEAGDRVQRTETTVDFDEALSFLDQEGRDHVKSLIRTVAAGAAKPGNGERLNGTLAGAARTANELHTLTQSLHGQEPQIATLVKTSSTVLSTIGDRERSVRTIVADGRRTLDALASNTASLQQGIDALPRLLASGRTSLRELRPLFVDARPVFARLREVSPDLARALDPNARHPLGESVDNLVAIADGLGPLSRRAAPILRRLKPLLEELVPVVKGAAPAARDLVPALNYLTPRSRAIATGYALLAASLKHEDSKGHYALLAANFDPTESTDTPAAANCDPATQNQSPNQGFCNNAYPGQDDALNPQPFKSPYTRVVPCIVPPRSRPTDPCK